MMQNFGRGYAFIVLQLENKGTSVFENEYSQCLYHNEYVKIRRILQKLLSVVFEKLRWINVISS
jgi:hypothetical protein